MSSYNFWGSMGGFAFVMGVILLIIFLVFREFFCWYWKINERLSVLNEIRDLLARNANVQGSVGAAPSGSPGFSGQLGESSPQPLKPDDWRVFDGPRGQCPNCDSVIPLNSTECPNQKCKALFGAQGGFKVKPV